MKAASGALLAGAVIAAALVPSHAAHAAGPLIDCTSDTSILNTGYDGAGGRLTSGLDAGWEFQLNATAPTGWAPANVVTPKPQLWIDSPYSNASWISHVPNGTHDVNDMRTVYYRYNFELAPEVDPDGFSVTLDFYADNSVQEVWVNGAAQSGHLDSVPQGGLNANMNWGFIAGGEASSTLDQDWVSGQNELLVAVLSSFPHEGFLAQTTSAAFCADFGDAPASYGTTKADGGASHLLEGFTGGTADLMLGAAVDTEADALGTTGSEDDATGSDDEDGVTALPLLAESATAYSVPVAVTNNTGADATLAGWVDFDRDGTFEPGERATATVSPGATSATLSWTGVEAHPGATFARLRLFSGSVANPSPVGRVSGGEVEDYALSIGQSPIEFVKTADVATASEGDIVEYTITVHNPSRIAAPGVSLVDNLSGVLDDAVYLDGSADVGVFSVENGVIAWTGDLGPGATATLTYTVRVSATPGGDRVLVNVVEGDGPAGNCPKGSTDARCSSIVTAGAPVDFGDAPAGYGADSGHVIDDFDGRAHAAGLGLGALVDAEDSAPQDDNADNAPDEDALDSVPALAASSTTYSLTVSVRNATDDAATLAGWIDSDRDGVFEASERATATVLPGATVAELTWTGVAATAGDSFLRLRLFDGAVADPQPTGQALGGEIEDYPLVITAAAAPGLAFTGATVPVLAGTAGVLLLLAGGLALLLIRRRSA